MLGEQVGTRAVDDAGGRLYVADTGLGLVVKEGAKNVVCTTADVAKEVLGYLKSEHGYGNKDTRMGKAVERHFGGSPYGWEPDMVRLVLAALYRAGEVEVAYQGNRYANYQDPASRTPFPRHSGWSRPSPTITTTRSTASAAAPARRPPGWCAPWEVTRAARSS